MDWKMKYSLIFLALMVCSSVSYSKDYEEGGVYFAPNDHSSFESDSDLQREDKESDYNDPHTVKEVLWGGNQCEHTEHIDKFNGQHERCHDDKGNLRRHTTDDGKTYMTRDEQKHKKFVHETPKRMNEKMVQDQEYQKHDSGAIQGYKRHKQSWLAWIKEKAGLSDEQKEVDVAGNDDNQEEVKPVHHKQLKSSRKRNDEESENSERYQQQSNTQFQKATSRRL